MTNDLQTVILVGGRGTRLKSLTENLPKPMMLIQGKPFLEILLKLLKRKGLSRFLLLSGYLHKPISDYFGDGSNFGLQIKYSVETEPLGTAGAIKNAQNLLEDKFLLLNGDTFSDIDYGEFVKFSQNQENTCSMLCYNGPLFDDLKYNLELGISHLVTDYSKLTNKQFNAVDAGLYFMRKKILFSMIKNKICSLEEEVFQSLISERKLAGFVTESRFYDIGTIERLDIFEKMFISKKAYNQ